MYANAEVELDEARIELKRGRAAEVRDRAAAVVDNSSDADAAESVKGRLKAMTNSTSGWFGGI